MVHITEQPIDTAELLSAVGSPHAGAVVLFLGTTREFTGERRTTALEYECYPDMALKTMQSLEDQARERWQLTDTAIVHRLGRLLPMEVSVAIAVSSPHREAAFQAGKWLIDELKRSVPIWKKENWHDGTSEWVHPGLHESERKES